MILLLRWIISALVLLLVAYIVPGVTVGSIYIALIAALLLGLVNAVIRPILIFLTLPVTLLSLGLWVLVINALMFWFIASFVQGFSVAGFGSAFLGALLVSIFSWISNSFLKE